MGTGWNMMGVSMMLGGIITDWDMGTGWNKNGTVRREFWIITDWDMGTGWNFFTRSGKNTSHYNRLGYGYWLELDG